MRENVPRRKRQGSRSHALVPAGRASRQASSWFHIGSHYERGLGVDKDPAKAAEAYRNGAEKGSSDAQQALGIMAAFGRGVPQDPAQAAYWLRLAADDEKPLACGVLGHCYLRGLGVQQDDGEAFALLTALPRHTTGKSPMTEKQARTLTSLWASSTTALGNCTPMGAGAPWTSRKAYDAFRPPPNWATATPDAISADSKGTGSANG